MEASRRPSHSHQRRQRDEQNRSDVADRASMVRIEAWVDQLKRMQRRMAGLHKQHRKAEACDQQTASPANQRI
jgi:hypothetical protein